jgi:hypothetical protein
MEDRELLRLSAKAVGIHLEYRHGSDVFYFDDPESGREEWNPPLKYGQALKLAVSLGIAIFPPKVPRQDGDFAVACVPDNEDTEGDWMQEMVGDGNPMDATCRAITRAAAEIGKAMQ